jgi:tetratricopeptide (TPR) repeat protein
MSFVPTIALVVVAGALAAATIVRNREYASPISLAQTVVDRRPSGIAYHILGEHLMLGGRDAEAIAPLTEAIARGDSRAGYPLGVALINGQKWDEAVRRLDAFVRTSGLPRRPVPGWLEPPRSEVVSARVLMARVFASERQWSQVEEEAELVLKLVPAHSDAQRLLAEALINIGFSRVVAGDLDQAVDLFRRAQAADPANPRARDLLALALKDQQRVAAER